MDRVCILMLCRGIFGRDCVGGGGIGRGGGRGDGQQRGKGQLLVFVLDGSGGVLVG